MAGKKKLVPEKTSPEKRPAFKITSRFGKIAFSDTNYFPRNRIDFSGIAHIFPAPRIFFRSASRVTCLQAFDSVTDRASQTRPKSKGGVLKKRGFLVTQIHKQNKGHGNVTVGRPDIVCRGLKGHSSILSTPQKRGASLELYSS